MHMTTTTTRPLAEARNPGGAGACWCGQELDVVRHGYCPRCGRRRATVPH
jgi:hypothetical protein